MLVQATKGSFINIPFGGAVHCFRNKSNSVQHLLRTIVPSGLEKFFEEIGKPVDAGKFLSPRDLKPEDLQKLKAVAEKFGQQLFPPDYLG